MTCSCAASVNRSTSRCTAIPSPSSAFACTTQTALWPTHKLSGLSSWERNAAFSTCWTFLRLMINVMISNISFVLANRDCCWMASRPQRYSTKRTGGVWLTWLTCNYGSPAPMPKTIHILGNVHCLPRKRTLFPRPVSSGISDELFAGLEHPPLCPNNEVIPQVARKAPFWLAVHVFRQSSKASPDQNRLACSVFKVLFTPIKEWVVPLCLKSKEGVSVLYWLREV